VRGPFPAERWSNWRRRVAPEAGAALYSCPRSAGPATAEARHALRVPRPKGRSFPLRQLPPTRVGTRHRNIGYPEASQDYDLRSTFASNALAAGISVFELARVMGTSVAMVERHYGTLIEGAGADIARRLSAFEKSAQRAAEDV
jgi:hypothetical protein